MWTTTKFLFFFLLLWSVSAFGRQYPPESQSAKTLPGMDVRWIHSAQPWTLLVEGQVQKSLNSGAQVHLKTGGRYKLSENFRLGLFYQAYWNRRNLENWVWDKSGWDRVGVESVVEPELSYRTMLLDKTRLEIRSSYLLNARYGQETVKLRVGFDHFIVKEGRVDNFFLSHEVFFPTNYARNEINEYWTYFGYLYQLENRDRVGLRLSYAEWKWTESTTFAQAGGPRYGAFESAWLLHLQYIFTSSD